MSNEFSHKNRIRIRPVRVFDFTRPPAFFAKSIFSIETDGQGVCGYYAQVDLLQLRDLLGPLDQSIQQEGSKAPASPTWQHSHAEFTNMCNAPSAPRMKIDVADNDAVRLRQD